jgi:hypothetical protein
MSGPLGWAAAEKAQNRYDVRVTLFAGHLAVSAAWWLRPWFAAVTAGWGRLIGMTRQSQHFNNQGRRQWLPHGIPNRISGKPVTLLLH